MEAARPGAKDAVIVFRLINDRVEIVDCFQWQSQLRYRRGLAPDVVKPFWHHPVYSICDSLYKMNRAASA